MLVQAIPPSSHWGASVYNGIMGNYSWAIISSLFVVLAAMPAVAQSGPAALPSPSAGSTQPVIVPLPEAPPENTEAFTPGELLYQQGLSALQDNLMTQAVSLFDEALKVQPDLFQAHYERGNAYLRLREYAKAISDYSKVIDSNAAGLLADAHNNRGYIYSDMLKKYDVAIRDFDAALRINPAYARAYYNRGLAYNRLNQLEKALADFNQVIALEPKYVDAYNSRGSLHLSRKQYQSAASDFEKAVAIDNSYTLGHYNLGLAYTFLKNYEKAIQSYTKALALRPDYVEALNNRGYLYNDVRKDYTKALADLNKALKLDPDYLDAYYNRGLAYFYQRQFAKAVPDFSRLLEENPKDADSLFYRGDCYYQLKQYDKAIDDLEEVVQILPKDSWSFYRLAGLYAQRHQTQTALKHLEKAIALNGNFKKLAVSEPDLQGLVALPAFKKLVK